MNDTSSDPLGLEKLNALFESVVTELQDSVQAGLGALHDLLDSAGDADFDVVNDAVIVVLDAATEGSDDVQQLLDEVFSTWSQSFGQSTEAIADIIRRLFEQFGQVAAFFRSAMETLVAAIADFPKRFQSVAEQALSNPLALVSTTEALLLPMLATGAAVFGTGIAAEALWLVLQDDGTALGARVSALELGFSGSFSPQASNLLQAPGLVLPLGTWAVAMVLEGLRQAGEFAQLLDGLPTGNGLLDGVFGPITQTMAQIASDYIENAESLAEALAAHLIEGAENQAELEWRLLQLARFTPVGVFLLIVATSVKLVTSPAPWLNLLFNPIEEDPRLSVRRLPQPSASAKYVVFSDVHRDEKDAERPPFQFGSIDHFLPNQDTYLDLLKYHAQNGYTVIEAGDCEELWFHRDFSVTIPEKMQQIVDTNAEIYAILRDLHAEGRYFRVFGNHDSYLRDVDTFAPLRAAMEADGAPAFRIHDFIIIEGVKTMHDVLFHLGLDSHPNAERKPLIITHGHQWDFWNCDANNILGKIIVSAVVTPLDMLDDPLRDLAGISSFGTPLVNFKQELSTTPIFSSWQSYEPAVVKLDKIQHMEDQERVFLDDIQYSETLAALMGMMIAVSAGPEDTCSIGTPSGCLMNLMSIGHTHNPHNMPYFDLGELPFAKTLTDAVEAQISTATAGLFNPQVGMLRSNYINTGISGWYDECFWALDLGDQSHGTGQPKLVTWTYNTRLDRPNHMDWELPHVPRNGGETPGDVLDEKIRTILAAGIDALSEGADRVLDVVGSLSSDALFAAAEKGWKPSSIALRFDGTRGGIDAFMLQLAMALLPNTEGAFTVSVELPKGLSADLARLMKSRLPAAGKSARRQMCAAIATLAVTKGALRSGLRGAEWNAETGALGALMLLAQLVEANRDGLSVQLDVKGGTVTGTITFAREKAVAAVSKEEDRLKRAEERGLLVSAYFQGAGTPLKGWMVQLETKTGRRTETLARARTDADGNARLLGARTQSSRLDFVGRTVSVPSLALYAPDNDRKPVKQIPLEIDEKNSRISLPVSYADLMEAQFFKSSKIPSSARRIQRNCDDWRKRLSNPRDRFSESDLCLHDLVLSTIGALENPKTAFEKQVAKTVKARVKDTSALPRAAEMSRKARKNLMDCLGDVYVECDGTGSVKDLGKRLLNENFRFNSLINFFGSPTPDPLNGLLSPKAGLGLPSGGFALDKNCVERAENGQLSDDLTNQIRDLMESGAVLAKPSINVVSAWDPLFLGGRVVRFADIPNKEVQFTTLGVTEGVATENVQDINMDVELDAPECLVLHADGTNRQAVITDVLPGQTVTLRGSGFVAEAGRVRANFQTWRATPDDGRLVPDDTVLPAAGFQDLELSVHSTQDPVDSTSSPTNYNSDMVAFRWPDTAGDPGLYRVRLTFKNESQYPTTITQNADCSIDEDRSDVSTQEIFFAVLPPAQSPAVRTKVSDVTCLDLTDPEGFLGIPFPDDLFLHAQMSHIRINISPDGSSQNGDVLEIFTDSDGYLLFHPGTWSPDMQLFPSQDGFDQIEILDSVIASYELFEVEGAYDKVLIGTILTVAIVVIALLAVAVAVAAFLILVALLVEPTQIGKIVAGALAATLAAVVTFIFGSAFTSFGSAVAAIVAFVDGQDSIGRGSIALDGQKLMFETAALRFHRVIAGGVDLSSTPPTPESLGQVFENNGLDGTYEVSIEVDSDG